MARRGLGERPGQAGPQTPGGGRPRTPGSDRWARGPGSPTVPRGSAERNVAARRFQTLPFQFHSCCRAAGDPGQATQPPRVSASLLVTSGQRESPPLRPREEKASNTREAAGSVGRGGRHRPRLRLGQWGTRTPRLARGHRGLQLPGRGPRTRAPTPLTTVPSASRDHTPGDGRASGSCRAGPPGSSFSAGPVKVWAESLIITQRGLMGRPGERDERQTRPRAGHARGVPGLGSAPGEGTCLPDT